MDDRDRWREDQEDPCWQRDMMMIYILEELPVEYQMKRITSLIVIYEGLYFDLAQGQMNGAPNENYITYNCIVYLLPLFDLFFAFKKFSENFKH